MKKLEKGYFQVYTGDGKGKTTAALGLGFRAAGDGYKVIMVQFLKGGPTGELNSVEKLYPNFIIKRFEKKRGFFWTLNNDEKKELKLEIQQAYEFCLKVLAQRSCDILIMDEVMAVLSNKLLSESEVIKLIENKPIDMELVMTGRNIPDSVLQKADLVTEMKVIKHYFEKGVPAREGIEY